METLLLIAFGAACIGLIVSLVVMYKLVFNKKAQRLEY
jgi:hypothetical protein